LRLVGVGYFFFFQAEDGIRDDLVTGVQTCALPILSLGGCVSGMLAGIGITRLMLSIAPASIPRLDSVHIDWRVFSVATIVAVTKIGRASCRERRQNQCGSAVTYREWSRAPV